MHDEIDRLSEAFTAHEHLAPNPMDVLERAGVLARSYRRRRRAVRATGASVLGAGIVAGGVALPGLKWQQGSGVGTAGVPAAASGNSLPVASGAAVNYSQQQELAEYFADGYNYDNAVALAALWHETDIDKVKADAGLKLLQGVTLPVVPSGTPEPAQQKAQEQAMNAFFAAGYGYDDAVTLSTLWHESDISQVKVDAGQKLLEGQTLPIGPSVASAAPTATPNLSLGPGAPETPQAKAVAAFFAAGYTYDDAVSLGKLWNETDTYQIKADAGAKLLAGQTLPILP